jgi:hypothetical protein
VAQTRTKDWRNASASRQGRSNRSAARPQAGRRFTRGTPQPQTRGFGRGLTRPGAGGVGRTGRRQPEPSGAKGLLRSLKGSLPGGSSGKRGGGSSLPGVGGLLSSLGGKKSGRGRKSAMFGLLGAGAAGAAVVAKRRKGSGSSDTPIEPEHITADSQAAPPTQVDGPPAPSAEYPPKSDESV